MSNLTNVLAPFAHGMVVGAEIEIFGMVGTVTIVEPASDWYWDVTVNVEGSSGIDTLSMRVPTDFRTDGNATASLAATESAAEWERDAEDAADERMQRMESYACGM